MIKYKDSKMRYCTIRLTDGGIENGGKNKWEK